MIIKGDLINKGTIKVNGEDISNDEDKIRKALNVKGDIKIGN